MNTKWTVAVTLICAIFMFGSNTSLKCYVCKPEDKNVKCNDDLFLKDLTLLKDCSTSNNQTTTAIGCAKIDIYTSDRKITKRVCINTYEELVDCEDKKFDRCEVCDTDGCNESSSLKSSMVITVTNILAICLILVN